VAEEVWKPVVGYEGLYEVSDLGRVRTLGRRRGGRGVRVLKIMTAPSRKCQAPVVHLWRERRRQIAAVHRLVARAFLGPVSEGCEVVHKASRCDASLINLEVTTHQAWMDRLALAGLIPCGERSYLAKLTADKVREIRASWPRLSCRALAEKFGVSPATILSALRRKTWRHLV
jgi:hypothetical protein